MKERITQRSSKPAAKDGTDWNRIDMLSDTAIDTEAAADPDAAPSLDAAWFAGAALELPEPKQAVSLRIDADVLQWYKAQGSGYLSRMNAVLRQYAKAHGAEVTGRSARTPRRGG